MAGPPPEGFKPLRACVACPPGGLVVDGGIVIADYPVDGYQTATLFRKGQYFFGTCLVGVLLLSLLAQVTGAEGRSLVDGVRKSLLRGKYVDQVEGVFIAEKAVEAPGSALVGGYAMSLIPDLSTRDAASAIVSLLLSAKATCDFFTDMESCVLGTSALVRVRMPLFKAIVYFVRFCSALGFFALFIVSSRTTHPALTIPVYVVSGLVVHYLQVSWSTDGNSKMSPMLPVIFPVVWCFPLRCSVYNIKTTVHMVCEPALPFILTWMMRVAVLVGLCTVVSLPHGFIGWSTLGRPMGALAFHTEFLEPTMAVIFGDSDDGMHMTYASVCFRSFVLIAAVVGTSIEMIFHFYALIFMRSYCSGVLDEGFQDAAKAKAAEVDRWCAEREAQADADSLQPLACEMT